LLRPPTEKAHWHEKWHAIDTYLNDIRGILTRVGDETVGEMWSLYDGRDVLNEIYLRFGDNIDRHIHRVLQQDIFHVSANPKGDRSKRPQDQDPDMMVHVVRETDAGIVLRGAKYETAASYADQAFLKPTIASWTGEQLSDYAVGCIVNMGSPGVKHLCRSGFAGRAPITRSPTTSTRSTNWSPRRCPGAMGGRVLLPPHPCRFVYPRDTAPLFGLPLCTTHPLHGRSHDRNGALWNVRQTGLDKLSTVREKLADLVCYREGINAPSSHQSSRRRRAQAGY